MTRGFKTGGRQKGVKNAKTIERERLQAEAAAELSKSGLVTVAQRTFFAVL